MNHKRHEASNPPAARSSLGELAALFLKLGATSLGGPIAHIARMEDEIVARRQWLDRQHFLDLVGATNLIPGPNSTELAIHIGQLRAGTAGLIVAGTCFIAPAMFMVLALAWWYIAYGQLPAARAVLFGAQPVVVAIVAQALWRFARTAIKNAYTAVVAAIAAMLLAFGVGELTVIAIAAAAGLAAGTIAARQSGENPPRAKAAPMAMLLVFGGGPALAMPSLGKLFLVFLKIGSIIYGSGYVLLAFLRSDLVENTHWLTDRQLLDAVAIGQITPGPVFTTATFVGYIIGSEHHLGPIAAALCATIGIFLPSFIFVALLSVILDRWKNSPVLRWFLDTVNVASLVLMAAVTLQLAHAALWTTPGHFDLLACGLAVVSLALLLTTRLNSAWFLAAGAIIGWIVRLH